ncbi:YciI family protein [Actinomadura verrucosospora]|nr:YciI family protein [Actinomadura verrucosospora]
MFLLLLHYDDGVHGELDALIPEHYEYVDRHMKAGTFLLTARRDPRVGGVILADGTDRERIEAITAEDPFLRTGGVRYEIIAIEPTRSALAGITV